MVKAKVLQSLRKQFKRRPRRSPSPRTRGSLHFEALEDRRLLAVIGSDLPEVDTGDAELFFDNQLLMRWEAHTTPEQRAEILHSGELTVVQQIPRLDMVLVELPSGSNTVLSEANRWTAHPAVKYAEPNFVWTSLQVFPNDPLFGIEWGLHNTGQMPNVPIPNICVPASPCIGQVDADIDAPEAWTTTTGSSDVVVAVIDTGIDYTHPDLFTNMWRNPGEIANNQVDDDNNGYVDDLFGVATAVPSSDPMDNAASSHGTHVAGTIGAQGNNGIGVTGVVWETQLMAVNIAEGPLAFTSAAIVLGIDYVTMMKVDYGVNIVASNNSWGGPSFSQAILDVVRAQTDAGILFVAAAGNGGADGIGDNNDALPMFPASYDLPGILSVAASNDGDVFTTFSNFGRTTVDVAAPGQNVYSTIRVTPAGLYGSLSGTSMASPHVAGMAAALKSADPSLSMLQIKDLIMRGVDPLTSLSGLLVTGGRVNLRNSLNLLQSTEIRGTVFQDDNANARFDSFEQGLGGWTVYVDLNSNRSFDPNEPSAVSGPSGAYAIRTNLAPGKYSVAQVVRPNFQQTFPRGGAAQTVTIFERGQVINNIDFGNRTAPGSISGFKWHDLDGDAVRDAGEPGVQGVFIYVDLDNNGEPGVGEPAAFTDAKGFYRIVDAPSGTRTVREVLQPGWAVTFPDPTGFHVIVVNPNQETPNVNFGNELGVDFGDAPAPYPTTLAQNGARHGVVPGVHLGPAISNTNGGVGVDAEADGQPDPDALGDDSTGVDDEDGVVFPAQFFAGVQGSVDVTVSTGGRSAAMLQGWIDWNQDGDWLDTAEQIFTNVRLGAGVHTLTFPVPAGASLGATYARFRYGYETSLGPTGLSLGGEVEDYRINVLGDQPVANDDDVTVNQDSVDNILQVLSNDFPSSAGSPLISEVTNGNRGGKVSIGPDQTTVLYTPAVNFFGTETFTYTLRDAAGKMDTATVTVTVLPSFTDPVAVDDTFFDDAGDVSFVVGSPTDLDVLANDLPGQNGPLTLVSVTQPVDGQNSSAGSATIANGKIRYTPSKAGTAQLLYTVRDTQGVTSTARLTVHVDPHEADDTVSFRMELTDLNGSPITGIAVGQQFNLNIYVDDLRTAAAQPGVFSAYLDILYKAGLVSVVRTAGNPPFDIDYLAPYTEQRSGEAAPAGLLDEVGAVSSSLSPTGSQEQRAFVITFNANATGLATFKGDPADILPGSGTPPGGSFHEVTLYGASQAEPLDRIRYGFTSLQIVGSGTPPTAVDDSFQVPITGASLNVLANDLNSQNGQLTISNVSTPLNGNVTIDNNNTPNNPADDSIRYVPNAGFTGTEQFTYTIRNDSGLVDSATVTVSVIPGSAAGDRVRFTLQTTDINGNPVTTINSGSNFDVRLLVQDLRVGAPSPGVFAAYLDMLYPSGLVSVVTDINNPLGFAITFNEAVYGNKKSGDADVPGIVDEVGAFQTGGTNLGLSPIEVFRVRFRADNAGQAIFKSDPADISPLNDVLLFEPPQPVPIPEIDFGTTSLTITGTGSNSSGGFTNPRNALDVNNDGFVSPIDALFVINDLNQQGSHSLVSAEGEVTSTATYYPDVNGDGHLSPVDALWVINYLNQRSEAAGEGEAPSLLASAEAGGELVDDSLQNPTLTATSSGTTAMPTGLDSSSSRSISVSVAPSDSGVRQEQRQEFIRPAANNSSDRATDDALQLLAAERDAGESLEDLINELAGDVQRAWL